MFFSETKGSKVARDVHRLDYADAGELLEYITHQIVENAQQKREHAPIHLVSKKKGKKILNFWADETEGPHIFGRSGTTVATSREAVIHLETLELIVF